MAGTVPDQQGASVAGQGPKKGRRVEEEDRGCVGHLGLCLPLEELWFLLRVRWEPLGSFNRGVTRDLP